MNQADFCYRRVWKKGANARVGPSDNVVILCALGGQRCYKTFCRQRLTFSGMPI